MELVTTGDKEEYDPASDLTHVTKESYWICNSKYCDEYFNRTKIFANVEIETLTSWDMNHRAIIKQMTDEYGWDNELIKQYKTIIASGTGGVITVPSTGYSYHITPTTDITTASNDIRFANAASASSAIPNSVPSVPSGHGGGYSIVVGGVLNGGGGGGGFVIHNNTNGPVTISSPPKFAVYVEANEIINGASEKDVDSYLKSNKYMKQRDLSFWKRLKWLFFPDTT